MSAILPDDERVMITLPVSEWVNVAYALSRTFGPGDELFNKIRLAVATGN